MKKLYGVDKKFIDGLNENLLLVARHSFYTVFFMRQLWHELAKNTENDGTLHQNMFPDHKLCRIPLHSKEFRLFFWDYNSFDWAIGDTEQNLLATWLKDGKDIGSFYDDQFRLNSSKGCFIIDKIYLMINELIYKLQEISVQNKIPFQSIVLLIRFISSGSEDIDRIREYVKIFKIIPDILVPKNISQAEQDSLIIKISKQIYDLLIESFWILLIIDWIGFWYFLNFMKEKDPFKNPENIELIKEYLIDQTPFHYFEKYIQNADSIKILLNEYVAGQYYAAGKFHPVMVEFLTKSLSNAVNRYMFIIEKISRSPHSKGEEESIAFEFLSGLATKVNQSFLMTYKLTGDPITLLSYIKSILYNVALTEIGEIQNNHFKSIHGRSYKTIKSYLKEINIDRNNDKKSYAYDYDLNPDPIQLIAERKIQNQKHVKPNYVTQRELIRNLLDKTFLDGLDKKGLHLKRYKFGESKLKNAIQHLKKEGRIVFTQEKSAVYYRLQDIPAIATELAGYFKK